MTEDTKADANTQETPGAAASLSTERKDYIRKRSAAIPAPRTR